MPIHDWTRVDAGIFHHFHHTWITEIQRALNRGRLPPEYYALAEQIAGGLGPDVLTLQRPVNGTPSPSELTSGDRSSNLPVKKSGGAKPMSQTITSGAGKRWKASELRKLPPEQRDAVLEAAASQAEEDYRSDPDLTGFEAFGKEDLHGDSTGTQTR